MIQPTLRLGIAGLGQAAASMLPDIVAHPHVRLTAAADLRREARERFAAEFDGETYERVEDLCASPGVDAIYVATPHQFHALHTIAAIEHGKHVLLEKPMALTLEDCDAMIQAAENRGVHLLVGRGSHGFDPPVLRMREIIRAGDIGPLRMVNTWHFGDFLYRPRTPEELDTRLGGGVIFNQGPHQIDVVRVLAGGVATRVQAMTGIWDPDRRSEGAFVAYLELAGDVAATIVYSGYDHFDTDEFHWWVGTYGQPKKPDHHGATRRSLQALLASGEDEAALKASFGYGGTRRREGSDGGPPSAHQIHWGITLVSCERGDMRQSLDGILVYGDDGKREVPVPKSANIRGGVIEEFYDAIDRDEPPLRDGRWEKGTLEICLAILESARTREPITLRHQVPLRE
ncbi:MAG TPA: Gfo/Idh/MocA family oxidoreductase [Chloroflexota bacterium]|nr:Gfo/Idh/MocA family oxidoreductase [Chloroflexota bacterium]